MRLAPSGLPTANYLSIKNVAKKLQVNDRYVDKLINEGLLPAVRLSYKVRRIRESDVDALLERAMHSPTSINLPAYGHVRRKRSKLDPPEAPIEVFEELDPIDTEELAS